MVLENVSEIENKDLINGTHSIGEYLADLRFSAGDAVHILASKTVTLYYYVKIIEVSSIFFYTVA